MKNGLIRFLAGLLALCLLCSALAVAAFAADVDNGAKRWNIMLVIDGSGSLFSDTKTDPDGLRYEAVESLLSILQDDGHNVGAIVFSANQTESDSDEAMQKGIMLNTGLLSLDDDPSAKSKLTSQIPKHLDWHDGGTTDIGTALLTAQQELSKMNNGLDSAIFLFTDGVTELNYSNTRQKSLDNLNQATTNIHNEGIKFCGVFLNKDGKSSSTEVRDIVCAANGISSGDLSLGDSYVEITDAASMVASTDKFLSMLGMSLDDEEGGEIITSSQDKTFRIPGVGVEEVNLRLLSVDGSDLPKNLELTLTDPDGNVYSGATIAAICSSGRTYRIYKLKKPMAGTWKAHLEVPTDSNVQFYYKPIFSVYVGAEMTTDPAPDTLHMNMDATVTGVLTQSGQVQTDPAAYREYACSLLMTNIATGVTEQYVIQPTSAGNYSYKLHLAEPEILYGAYDVQVVFECDKIRVVSDSQTWILENHVPETGGSRYLDISCGLFLGNEKVVDLTDYIHDMEDGTDLQVTLTGTTCDPAGLTLTGTDLTVNGPVAEDGQITLNVTDKVGASAELVIYLDVTNYTVPILIAAAVLLIAIAIAVIVALNNKNKYIPAGECKVSFEFNENPVELNMPAPGAEGKRKLTLQELLQNAIQSEYSGVLEACNRGYGDTITLEELKDAVSRDEYGFSKIVLAVALKKVPGQKKPIAVVRMTAKGINQLLDNGSKTFGRGEKAVTVGYYESSMDFDDDEWVEEDTFDDSDNDVYDEYDD